MSACVHSEMLMFKLARCSENSWICCLGSLDAWKLMLKLARWSEFWCLCIHYVHNVNIWAQNVQHYLVMKMQWKVISKEFPEILDILSIEIVHIFVQFWGNVTHFVFKNLVTLHIKGNTPLGWLDDIYLYDVKGSSINYDTPGGEVQKCHL